MGNSDPKDSKSLPPDPFRVSKRVLDKISPSFCLAKWSRVTMYLQQGLTHSCYHPAPHQIPLDELAANPAALHNTSHKIKQREAMLEGKRPSECSYCWNIEDLASRQTSDRIFKSSTDFSLMMLEEILKNPLSPTIKPRYVEVSFSTKCQLKCSYCSPGLSSAWYDEISRFGAYPESDGPEKFNAANDESGPYINAFWEWWPSLKKDLHTLRLTGGEPLLSPNTFKVMNQLIQEPQPQLNLGINSNLSVPDVLFQKFNSLVKEMSDKNAVRSFELFASIDSFGAQAEYIRNGLNNDTFWSNIDQFLELNKNCRVTIMVTFGALSLFNFVPMLKKVLELKEKHKNSKRMFPIYVEPSYLLNPDYQSLKIFPATFSSYMDEIINFVDTHNIEDSSNYLGFAKSQRLKFKAIRGWMNEPVDLAAKQKLQTRFYKFFSEHDRRRNTDILNVFPELTEFWNSCKDLSEQPIKD
jgi:organic radical activating enzyme